MKTLLFRSLLFLVAFTVLMPVINAQDKPPVVIGPELPDHNIKAPVYLQPVNPSPVDSVRIFYKYVSNDGCPDFYLAIDSVVGTKIYVGKKAIENPPMICTMVVRTFVASLNLGILAENSTVYFDEGKLINTIKYPCYINKIGKVVPGVDGCTGELFISELANFTTSSPRLYRIDQPKSGETMNLKAGDQVKFGGYMVKKEAMSILCPFVGVATCYELIVPVKTYSLSGIAVAGVDTIIDGKALLIKKGGKTLANSSIYNGKYVFANVPEGDYTVFVIPVRPFYRYYLPTYYVDKLRLSEATYVTLNQDIKDLTVILKPVQLKEGKDGTGKIHGRATYDKPELRDSMRHDACISADKRVANRVPVVLMNDKNEPVAWAETGDDGEFVFDGVASQRYRVVVESSTAIGESDANLSTTSDVTADIILRSPGQTTAVNTVEKSLLQVYPNPATESLYINMKEAGNVQIFNAVGQIMFNKYMQEGVQELDIRNFQQGVLLIKTDEGNFRVIKR